MGRTERSRARYNKASEGRLHGGLFGFGGEEGAWGITNSVGGGRGVLLLAAAGNGIRRPGEEGKLINFCSNFARKAEEGARTVGLELACELNHVLGHGAI